MDWDSYYEKFYDWATSTQIKKMSSLTSFGASAEVSEVAQEYMDEKAASRLIKKAVAYGVQFTPDDKCSVAKDALMDVRVPEMIIKLKQGIGRLIRNFTDTGIVCIIDRRLRDEPPERYHDITWDSLPIKNRTSSLDELRKFYEGLPSAKE